MSEYTLAVKVFAYADGTCSGSALFRPADWTGGSYARADGAPEGGGRARVERPDLSRDQLDAMNRRRSARRSRQLLIRHVRSQGMDCLGTLTFGGDILPEPYQALELAATWYRLEGRELLGGHPAVLVPEHGEDNGRIHVHLGLHRHGARWDYSRIIRSWSEFLAARGYESPTGNHRVHFSGQLSSRRLSKYLAKYLGKQLEDIDVPKGCHRYRNIGCDAVQPAWVGVVDSVSGFLGALGLPASLLYPYRLDRGNGSTVLIGFGFDDGG